MRALRMLLCAGCLATLAACGRSEPPPGPFPGNVAFLWHFSDGNTCASLGPAAATIQVQIPGEALENGGFYPCDVNGVDGIVLNDFAPGGYDFSLTALDAYGNPTYAQSGSFAVDGDVQVDVTLFPVGVVAGKR